VASVDSVLNVPSPNASGCSRCNRRGTDDENVEGVRRPHARASPEGCHPPFRTRVHSRRPRLPRRRILAMDPGNAEPRLRPTAPPAAALALALGERLLSFGARCVGVVWSRAVEACNERVRVSRRSWASPPARAAGSDGTAAMPSRRAPWFRGWTHRRRSERRPPAGIKREHQAGLLASTRLSLQGLSQGARRCVRLV
jgi:hypothetical protein